MTDQYKRKRRASLESIAADDDEFCVSISSIFEKTATLTVRRAMKHCTDNYMTKTKICSTKQGLCANILLQKGPTISNSQLWISFAMKLSSCKVAKAKFKTIRKVEKFLDFETIYQNQITMKDFQAHAAVLLQLCTTLFGAEIVALNSSSILNNTKEMLMIAPQRKKHNFLLNEQFLGSQIRTFVQTQQWKPDQTKLHKPLEMINCFHLKKSGRLSNNQEKSYLEA
ncbi:MAG: hypothetical protein EZS28_013972 [Streblomastix strix]|uniref:Uncharacterized protein n=1 Tax=Streblomastix strix TaxID=222440 RepID=A0A5J4W7G5_9EUKA|nr:MAG: hypothetical protein EZS28_013972 [Streblomastix strix]